MKIDEIRNRRNRSEILVISDSLAVRETLALRNREESLRVNLDDTDIEQAISNQGSAPFKVINQVTKKMIESGVFPELEGVGLELGCGSALFSISMLEHDSKRQIQAIIAVEAAKEFVEETTASLTPESLAEPIARLPPLVIRIRSVREPP